MSTNKTYPHLEKVINGYINKNPERAKECWYSKIRHDDICSPINRIISEMDKKNIKILQMKFDNLKGNLEETNKQFLEIFVEIIGFIFLSHLGYQPSFVEKNKSRTPDLISRNKKICMECKNIRNSMDENAYLDKIYANPNIPIARALSTDMTDFFNKLSSTINIAKEQTIETSEIKYIFINLSLDGKAKFEKKKIIDILSSYRQEDFDIIFIENYNLDCFNLDY